MRSGGAQRERHPCDTPRSAFPIALLGIACTGTPQTCHSLFKRNQTEGKKGIFLPLSYKGVSLPPQQPLIPSPFGSCCRSLTASLNFALFSPVPRPHIGFGRDDSTALLIGSVSELLLQSRRGHKTRPLFL